MKTMDEITLTQFQINAIKEVKGKVPAVLNVEKMFLFGSVARNSSDEESDTDILILTKEKLSRDERHQITDIVFDINLTYGTCLSTTVIDIDSWENGVHSVLPFHKEIEKDVIPV